MGRALSFNGKMKVKLKVMLIITQVFDSMGELDGDGDSECCLLRQEWDNDEDDDYNDDNDDDDDYNVVSSARRGTPGQSL